MKHMALIPARISSTRLKQKPLQKVFGTSLIEHVADAVLKTGVFDQVCVATDSNEILDLFKSSSVKAVMTSAQHESGTDRICEALEVLEESADVVFNIQGDEPFVYKEDFLAMKKVMESGAAMASMYEKIDLNSLKDLNKVKVLLNDKSEAIYFSRFAAPFSRSQDKDLNSKYIGKHIGLYAYQSSFLKAFCKTSVGYHESYEKLEQLRALQMGEKIKMVFTENSYYGIDTKEDLERMHQLLKDEQQ